MKIERTKTATRNIIYGGLLKIYQILLPFLMRTVILYTLGVKYLGLNGLFVSILQVLNLAELGVGSAMVYSMYKPIVEDDKKTICALMNLYKIYYRIIGVIILAAGLSITPLIPQLISGEVPEDTNLYILYWLNLISTVLTYWLFAYKSSILQAFARNDLISKVTLFTETCKYILQVLALVIFHNYYYFVIIILITQIATNVITAAVAGRYYPEYIAQGRLEKEETAVINGRIKDLFTSKLGAVVVNSADSVVISAYLGLSILAVYQNYFYVINSIIGFVTIIFTSTTAGIGNSILVESEEKNFRDLSKFTFLIMWIAGFCTGCLICLYQPFMILWVGKEYMLPFKSVICFCIYYFVYEMNQIWTSYKDAAGMWHEDRFRPLCTALANLIMNIVMVRYIGLYGVMLSTVLSTVIIGMPWLIRNIFTVIFSKKYMYEYLRKIFYYVIIVLLVCSIDYLLCDNVNLSLIMTMFLRLLICVTVTNILFYLFFFRTREFKDCVDLFKKILKGNK